MYSRSHMAILVTAHELKKSFGARPLFDGLTFTIESGERIGLIGPNGAGKSTLMRVLAGQSSPDGGTLSFQRGLRVGFLEQVPTFKPGATILSAVLEGTPDPDDWENQIAAMEQIGRVGLERFEDPSTQLVGKLSGGWAKRTALARELVKNPDLLLMDEPTNHLDIEGILWLEKYMLSAPCATLTVTHDRLFLQRIGNRIIELDRRNPGGLLSIKGDYATYREIKDANMASQERREVILKNTLRRETEWLRRGAKARTTKQQARIQRHGELSSDVADLTDRNQVKKARLDFAGATKAPKKLIEAKGISKTLGGKLLFDDLDLLLTPQSRIGLLGYNGCGKSSLIRVLLGTDAPDTGEVKRSEHLAVSYFEQDRGSLDPKLSVSRTLVDKGDFVDYRGARVHIRGYLDRFLFTPEQAEMAVGKLSGGEQCRLLFARMMLKEANVLVLDEPTNDLDLATLAVLEECLTEFDGAVLLVTHDRYFLDQVAEKIIAFPIEGAKTGHLNTFEGLEQWENWVAAGGKGPTANPMKAPTSNATATAARSSGAMLKSTSSGSAAAGEVATAAAAKSGGAKRKLSYNDQRELEGMEARIHAAEAEVARLDSESRAPTVQTNAVKLNEILSSLTKAQAELDRLFARWEALEAE